MKYIRKIHATLSADTIAELPNSCLGIPFHLAFISIVQSTSFISSATYNICQNGAKFLSWNHNLILYNNKPSSQQNYFIYLRGNHLLKLGAEKLYYLLLSVYQTTAMVSEDLLYILNWESRGKNRINRPFNSIWHNIPELREMWFGT
jgi:hypothetical protein